MILRNRSVDFDMPAELSSLLSRVCTRLGMTRDKFIISAILREMDARLSVVIAVENNS